MNMPIALIINKILTRTLIKPESLNFSTLRRKKNVYGYTSFS